MRLFLMILLAVASIILIASVLLQSGNSSGLSEERNSFSAKRRAKVTKLF